MSQPSDVLFSQLSDISICRPSDILLSRPSDVRLGMCNRGVYRTVSECGGVARVRVPLRRAVLRGAPVQRQARVLVRLPGAGRARDPPQQPRRRLPEDSQDMSRQHPHRIALHTFMIFSK